MSATIYKAFNTNCLSNSIVEGVSKSSFQCGRECIKIMKDAKKGCVAAQPCLTPGSAAPRPVQAYLTHTKRPRRGRTYLCTGSYSPTYGDGIAMILSTPGSAPLRSPRPALSIIGQLRSPSLYFDTLSIWLDKLLILNVLYVVANIETRHATSLLMAKSHFDTPSASYNGILRTFISLFVCRVELLVVVP